MDVRVDDVLQMKKNHPCGEKMFKVLRSGMDFRLSCIKCGRTFLVSRQKAEKNIVKIFREDVDILKTPKEP